MATKYLQGTTIKAKSEFRNVGGSLVDPSAVALKYKSPDGSITTKTFALGDITKDSAGVYEIYVTLSQVGNYVFRWEGSGNDGSVSETTITVSPSQVI